MARFLRRLVILGLLGGLAAWLRRALNEEDPLAPAPPQEPTWTPAPAKPAPATPAPASPGNGAEPTKAELYERAQELEIEGRSKMSKDELARAIKQAG